MQIKYNCFMVLVDPPAALSGTQLVHYDFRYVFDVLWIAFFTIQREYKECCDIMNEPMDIDMTFCKV